MAPVTDGRRSLLLHLMLVAVLFLAAPPIFPAFFLGPLAVLLLVSRPARREWIGILVAVVGLLLWARVVPDSLTEQTVRAAAVCYTGAFVAITVTGMRSLSHRALLALAIATVIVVGWFAIYHLRFADLQHDFVTQTWQASRGVSDQLPSNPPAVTPATFTDPSADLAHRLAAMTAALSSLYPAILALAALLSTWLAWIWYRRIARYPMGSPVQSFRDFRFNDHLIWLLVSALALVLFRPPEALQLLGENALVVAVTLFWMRGLAVLSTALKRASPLVIGIVILIMFPLAAFVLVGLTLLGVADTWIDFRRRMAPPTGVPS